MNTELVNLLISLDKNAENLSSKYFSEIKVNDSALTQQSRFYSHQKLKPDQLKLSSVVAFNDRRERRTLRAKVNSILNSLPECCSELSKNQRRSMKNQKKKKLDEINLVRRKLNKEMINLDDFSLSDSFDNHGNIKKKLKSKEIPLTPRTALRQNISPHELEMLKEDPIYFIQNEKYKYTIKLNDERWDKLIDNEPNKSQQKTLRLNSISQKDNKKKLFFIDKISEKYEKKLSKKKSEKPENFLNKKEPKKNFFKNFRVQSENDLKRSPKDTNQN